MTKQHELLVRVEFDQDYTNNQAKEFVCDLIATGMQTIRDHSAHYESMYLNLQMAEVAGVRSAVPTEDRTRRRPVTGVRLSRGRATYNSRRQYWPNYRFVFGQDLLRRLGWKKGTQIAVYQSTDVELVFREVIPIEHEDTLIYTLYQQNKGQACHVNVNAYELRHMLHDGQIAPVSLEYGVEEYTKKLLVKIPPELGPYL